MLASFISRVANWSTAPRSDSSQFANRFLFSILETENKSEKQTSESRRMRKVSLLVVLQIGKRSPGIDSFLCELRRGVSVQTALASPTIPKAARLFVEHTFTVIDSGNLCAIASAFTFGREDLLPDVFQLHRTLLPSTL